MTTKVAALSILAGVLAASSPVFAHHGNAAYDGSVVELKNATVTKLSWANSHTTIEIYVKYDKRKPAAPGNLGVTNAAVAPGDMIPVFVHQAKSKNPVGRIDHIVLADGSSLLDSGGGGGNNDVDNGRGRGGRGGRGGAPQN